MDRLSQLRGEAGGSEDSTLDTTSPPSEAFMSANENSSKYFSINDSTFDITPIKDVSLASTSADADRSIADGDELMSNLSPIGKKELDSYKIGKQIEAANILSGGVDIFDGNDNSFDGDELVIDDNIDAGDKANNEAEMAPVENIPEPEPTLAEPDANAANREMEVVLQIDGNNVNAIDIGNGLYLYRKDGQDELAAIQIIDDDPQHSFKFLKVRDNAEGNLEVYEEIEIEVPKEVPTKEGKPIDKSTPYVPTVDINKAMSDSSSAIKENKNKSPQKEPVASTSTNEKNTEEKEAPLESNLNGKTIKFSESRKSPVVGSFTPVTFHSTPNKEGKPLTKTMVDLQLDPNRHSDNVKKTIEVHTENIKQKPTEFLAKEKDTVEIVKSVDTITAEKEIMSEKSIKVIEKQEVKKDSPKNEDELNQTKSEICESTGDIHNSEMNKNKEKSAGQKIVVEDQNKANMTHNSSKDSSKREIESIKIDDIVLEKEGVRINDKDLVLLKPDKSLVQSQSISKEENKAALVNDEKHETTSKPEQHKPVEMNVDMKPIPKINELIENSSLNKRDMGGNTVKFPIPAMDIVQKVTHDRNEPEEGKLPKIKILENITLNFPTSSNVTSKPDIVKDPIDSSMKNDDDDNVIKFPLESFSEVSSTCTNLGSEESKEESITLYSIDTDESVSLITPSSTTKIRDDKLVLSDKISEVLTTMSNLSNIQTQNTSVKDEKVIESLPAKKKSTIQAKSKSEADSTIKILERTSSSKLENPVPAETIITQKDPKEVKEDIPVPETKFPEKVTSIPISKMKDSGKLAPCTLKPKEKLSTTGHSTTIELKLPVKKTLPTLAPKIMSSGKVISEVKPLTTGKMALYEIKPLTKAIELISESHTKQTEKSAKSASSQDVKPIQSAAKLELKPQEKPVVPASLPDVNTAENKHFVSPPAKVTNITLFPGEIKQSEISSITSNKTLKPDSHIPVASVANKPGSKHISVIGPKVVAILKPVDNTTSQKELAKSNTSDKNFTACESYGIKEPIKKLNVESIPVNNNHTAAVPFGKWTDAHRQQFVNKFKEIKAPLNTNSKQIKNSNDLNRRDVLQKIDSQRAQTISNATAKAQEKVNVKSEAVFSSKVVSPTIETKTLHSDLIDNKHINQISIKFINKQENTTSSSSKTTISSTMPTPCTNDVNSIKSGKTKPGHTGQTIIGKIELASKEQNTVSKLEPAVRDQIAVGKTEPTSRDQTTSGKTDTAPRDQNTASCYMASLIDKTIEDMINKVAPSKNIDEPKQAILPNPNEHDSQEQKPNSTEVSKPAVVDSVSLDDIEMKMNELHGIPFVERPPHELPKILKPDVKTYSKIDKTKPVNVVSKISNTNISTCETKLVKGTDSDEEIIEHEPITGDLDLKKKSVPIKIKLEEKKDLSAKSKIIIADKHVTNKEAEIITETDFDKFARRNSVTYENRLTVNFDRKELQNIVQTIKEKDLVPKVNPKPEPTRNEGKSKLPTQTTRQPDKSQAGIHSTAVGDSSSKKYQSKIHSAYQSAMTAKHQVSRPIGIIEDKPVKVVFLESSIGFVPSQLNVQGKELSPAKKSEADIQTVITANNDLVDSCMSDVIYENKQDKTKTKHQRKQVLTPVEAPDLELIQPSDIGIETTSKKKRKVEDAQAKNLVPKKSYLLGRNTTNEGKISNTQDIVKDNLKDTLNRSEDVPEHKDTATAIDNLVKAAELLENQAETENKSNTPNTATQTNTPVKRGRGRPRKYPLPDGTTATPATDKLPSPQKKPRLIDAKPIKLDSLSDEQDDDSSDEAIVRENWTMGKINENIVCPICNKLFRSENVVFKHVKHCTGVSPNRSESDKKSPQRQRLSQESEDIVTDYEVSESESKKDSPKKRKSKESSKSEETTDQAKLDLPKDDVIVIEDTPVKDKSEKFSNEKEPIKESNAKVPYRNKSFVCEFCGKIFRQQSYLASHKLQHKKDIAKKKEKNDQESNKVEVFSCEVCKKEFRKLHHLVQHRINHNPDTLPKRALRKSLSEQNDTKILKEDAIVKHVEDASAGFRCEPCDKSFRKLHHLVEHRGTHDGINRQKPSLTAQPTVDKPPPPPQCEICKKTFRKLHHLIEHKEQHVDTQHVDTTSDKSDDKSIKSALSTRDIIHECSLCYMVFPNEHSLNKHSVMCSKKKRQSKQLKGTAENDSGKDEENSNSEQIKSDIENPDIPQIVATEIIDDVDNIPKQLDVEEVEKSPEIVNIVEEENLVVTEVKQTEDVKMTVNEVPVKPMLKEEAKVNLLSTSIKRDIVTSDNKEKEKPVVPEKIKKIDLKEVKTQDLPKKKTVIKDKSTDNVTKRQKSTDAPSPTGETIKPSVESSDDDEIRYMLNPKFKVDEASEGKTFMKVRARKRNSLQIERPNNDHAKRRTSLQLLPKISRLKPKAVETKSKTAMPKLKITEPNAKLTDAKPKQVENKTSSVAPLKLKHVSKSSEAEAVLSTDSDDSDVKYSFPKTAPEISKPTQERTPNKTERKVPRKSLAQKRKSLGGIAKRKSTGKAITAKHKDNNTLPPKPIKRRSLGVEHRCDCGELFSSAALLARHTSLAHTPPRIRRRRDPLTLTQIPATNPSPKIDAPSTTKPTRKSSVKTEPTRKTSIKTEPTRKSSVKTEPTRKTSVKTEPTRKSSVKTEPTRKSSVKTEPTRKSSVKTEPTRKSNVKTEPTPAGSRISKVTQPEAKPAKTRRSAAHSGVPIPEKMRKLMQKNAK